MVNSGSSGGQKSGRKDVAEIDGDMCLQDTSRSIGYLASLYWYNKV